MNVTINNNAICVILLVFLSIISCEKKGKADPKEKVKVEVSLPTSIFVNEEIEGDVIYTSDFDSIKLDSEERRYIFLYLTKSKDPIRSFEDLKKVQTDTFVAITNNIIPIYDLKFNKKGKVFLEGYILDQVYLKDVKDSIKVRTIETRISHPITVKAR